MVTGAKRLVVLTAINILLLPLAAFPVRLCADDDPDKIEVSADELPDAGKRPVNVEKTVADPSPAVVIIEQGSGASPERPTPAPRRYAPRVAAPSFNLNVAFPRITLPNVNFGDTLVFGAPATRTRVVRTVTRPGPWRVPAPRIAAPRPHPPHRGPRVGPPHPPKPHPPKPHPPKPHPPRPHPPKPRVGPPPPPPPKRR